MAQQGSGSFLVSALRALGATHRLGTVAGVAHPTHPHSAPLPNLPPPMRPHAALTWQEVLFTGWCGLRGAISLILIADFVSQR